MRRKEKREKQVLKWAVTQTHVLTFHVTPALWQFIDDPGLKNDTRNMPVQLPLAHSGWLFKEESDEPEAKPFSAGPKEEDMEVDVPALKGNLCQPTSLLL